MVVLASIFKRLGLKPREPLLQNPVFDKRSFCENFRGWIHVEIEVHGHLHCKMTYVYKGQRYLDVFRGNKKAHMCTITRNSFVPIIYLSTRIFPGGLQDHVPTHTMGWAGFKHDEGRICHIGWSFLVFEYHTSSRF